jgi:outer membrane protein OmpA-like peptidoglycan-associated protein
MTGRRGAIAVLAAIAALAPGVAGALEIALPRGAVAVETGPALPGQVEIASAPWTGDAVPTMAVSGLVRRATWQIPDAEDGTVATVAATLETQLRAQGYEILLSCADRACGGFDFRHALDMGRSPEMHVDIGNFRYIAATREDGEAVALTVSRGGDTLYVNAVQVGGETGPQGMPEAEDTEPAPAPIAAPDAVTDAASLTDRLLAEGHVPLDDLGFRTGASELDGGSYASLETLAQFLAENAARRVVLVGHTDAEGGLEANMAVSEARAVSVRRYLVNTLGVDPRQVQAAGIGYLAPRATNRTPEGRDANRRVEVVLLEAD